MDWMSATGNCHMSQVPHNGSGRQVTSGRSHDVIRPRLVDGTGRLGLTR